MKERKGRVSILSFVSDVNGHDDGAGDCSGGAGAADVPLTVLKS